MVKVQNLCIATYIILYIVSFLDRGNVLSKK